MKVQGTHANCRLQIATSDGRVKFVGHEGVECTASSASQSPTRYLQFLPKKGALLRVTEVLLQVTDVTSQLCCNMHQIYLIPCRDCQCFAPDALQDGDLQLWSLSDGHLLESIPFADPVTAVAIMHDEPFILLGCASGSVQVVSMLDSSGSVAVGAAPVHTLELQPFQGCALPCHGAPHIPPHALLEVKQPEVSLVTWLSSCLHIYLPVHAVQLLAQPFA